MTNYTRIPLLGGVGVGKMLNTKKTGWPNWSACFLYKEFIIHNS